MFSTQEKQHIAQEVERILLALNHPEMPKEKPRFTLQVNGQEAWSWAIIQPNWMFDESNPPKANPWNEQVREEMKKNIPLINAMIRASGN